MSGSCISSAMDPESECERQEEERKKEKTEERRVWRKKKKREKKEEIEEKIFDLLYQAAARDFRWPR